MFCRLDTPSVQCNLKEHHAIFFVLLYLLIKQMHHLQNF